MKITKKIIYKVDKDNTKDIVMQIVYKNNNIFKIETTNNYNVIMIGAFKSILSEPFHIIIPNNIIPNNIISYEYDNKGLLVAIHSSYDNSKLKLDLNTKNDIFRQYISTDGGHIIVDSSNENIIYNGLFSGFEFIYVYNRHNKIDTIIVRKSLDLQYYEQYGCYIDEFEIKQNNNDAIIKYIYNNNGDITDINIVNNLDNIFEEDHYDYEYDDNGNISNIKSTLFDASYKYDKNNNITNIHFKSEECECDFEIVMLSVY